VTRAPAGGFLLDTATISEWTKPHPDPGVITWLDEVDEDRTYLSVVTIGEVRYGIELLPDGRRRDRLASWLADEVLDRFQGRVLPVNAAVAHAWGRLNARLERNGRKVDPADTLIAATAESFRLKVVTRNLSDFEPAGVAVVNPWTG
jgi:toxin FitB